MRFKFYKQYDAMDCGPASLRMIVQYYGRNINQQTLSKLCHIEKQGVSLLGISEAAEKIGIESYGLKLSIEQLKEIELPCILHWHQNHFIVLYKIKGDDFYIADPAVGKIKLNSHDFRLAWAESATSDEGIALVLTTTSQFYDQKNKSNEFNQISFLANYFFRYKKLLFQLLLGLLIGSFLQLITPFLTQSIVDVGIKGRNINFIYIILIAQIMLVIGRVSIEFTRSWILLHISTRINITILTDFLIKLMKLPMSYFDTKMTGDIMQRMNDQRKIESFLTGSTLNTLFSVFNLVIYSIILVYYNLNIFLVFLVSSMLYTSWIFIFLKRRRELNYKNFSLASKNQSVVVQLVNGMQEIKLNNSEQQKRWEWENIQAGLFKFNTLNLKLNQYQQGGSTLINEGTNLLITFLSAKAVISGNLTLGAMVALQYIVGQLNNPIQQLLTFIQGYQDAVISLERLEEVENMPNEELGDKIYDQSLPEIKDITIKGLTFRYPGAGAEPVFDGISLHIAQGKTTAIVGMSGSGKTSLLKLLLRFYSPERGDILVGNRSINDISYKAWRSQCGVVMQEGFIFSDSIERNIAVGDDYPDANKLAHAIKMANIKDLIEGLPLGLKTKIGAEGNGISQGQKQRLLIARAVYKNPHYIFFDEATNALDSENERIIINNLDEFFRGRTVIIVAHRLSTVKHADNIVVLDKGLIIEQGTHAELTLIKGEYYKLVKNQLELGT